MRSFGGYAPRLSTPPSDCLQKAARARTRLLGRPLILPVVLRGPHNVISYVWAGVAQTVQIRSELRHMAAPAAEDHGGPAPPTTFALEVRSIKSGPREIQVPASLEERCTSAGYPPTVLEAMASHTVVGFSYPPPHQHCLGLTQAESWVGDTCTHTHSCAHTHTHARAHTRARAHSHTQTHTHTHTHTHTDAEFGMLGEFNNAPPTAPN